MPVEKRKYKVEELRDSYIHYNVHNIHYDEEKNHNRELSKIREIINKNIETPRIKRVMKRSGISRFLRARAEMKV